MENNNGRGIFYGVIGVATLVVAIIGATFAYFSASAANNNAIKVSSTTLSLKFVGETNNFYPDMIPVDSTNANFKLYPGLTKKVTTGENKKMGHGTCSDDLGNSICGVYQFTVQNPSETVAQTVYGSLTVKANDFPIIDGTGASNIHYAVFKGTPTEFDVKDGKVGSVTANDTVMVVGKTALGAKDSENKWTNATQLLAPGATQTYTVVVWLEENGTKNSGDQGKMFNAAIRFDTGGESGVTGTLSAGGAAAQ